jgi:transcriptional regulator NrdR family protein
MNCPNCHHRKSRIVDTRSRRRRHECLACHTRWSTVEVILNDTIAATKRPRLRDTRTWLEKIQAKLAEV